MHVSYLTDIETMKSISLSDIYTMFPSIRDDAYMCAFAEKSVEGKTIVQVGSEEYIEYAKIGLVHSIPKLKELRNEILGVVITDEGQYRMAKSIEAVDIIAIRMPSEKRMFFINSLVESEDFDYSKEHWLYGVSNPAEMAMYRHFFSSYTSRRISVAICGSCYFASVYGVSFSWDYGVIKGFHQISDFGVQLRIPRNYDRRLSKEQYRLFLRNQELVRDFSLGAVARSYAEKIRIMLDGGGLYEDF
jgi:hypothetical protein